ncbi:hypothetical protein LTR84_000274 [Exophiala bonariae]|uniref:Uncharacterized protein n=1 Tax=Exophiala bonariae TaxID=1690606 RepID=A0AAV9NR73_9EURO|nr:hypothetical protein LTR84_000274 [Exophiala bonariae]
MLSINRSPPVMTAFFRHTSVTRIPIIRNWKPAKRYSSSNVVGSVKVDQTKKSNNPSRAHETDHTEQAQRTGSSKGRDHPAKQPDPQESPSKATGIQSEGPDSKAGAKEDKGVTTDRGAGPFMKQ